MQYCAVTAKHFGSDISLQCVAERGREGQVCRGGVPGPACSRTLLTEVDLHCPADLRHDGKSRLEGIALLMLFCEVQLSLDVRGKSTLEESLDLYVQGELMEGDNQYLCEEAGKKVPMCLCMLCKHVYMFDYQPFCRPLTIAQLPVSVLDHVIYQAFKPRCVAHIAALASWWLRQQMHCCLPHNDSNDCR